MQTVDVVGEKRLRVVKGSETLYNGDDCKSGQSENKAQKVVVDQTNTLAYTKIGQCVGLVVDDIIRRKSYAF